MVPVLAICDGALGFWVAMEEDFPPHTPSALLCHKTRNALNALPKSVQPKAKQAFQEI
ncbi:MAG TPA: hypothetical protein VLA60_14085 [Nitrospirales bacterium]|nr:hypothetical protein [Nitrospirales bacterium]